MSVPDSVPGSVPVLSPPGVVLRAAALYVPETEVTSADLGQRLGLSAAEIVRRTGVRTRRWAPPQHATSTLGTRAAQALFKETGVDPAGVDRILVSTTSPDMAFPATACLIQQALGISSEGGAMDVFASCTGFLAALSMARAAILTGEARRILVISADVKSRFLDLDDPATAILFGDGAGAALIEADPHGTLSGGRVGPVTLRTDGSRWHYVHMPAGGSRLPLSADTLAAGQHTLKMDGIPLFRMAVSRFSEIIRATLERDGLGVNDIACFVFHQANLRILEAVAGRLGIPEGRVCTTLERYGNTSSASLPITLATALSEGRIGDGDNVLLATFGGGLTWGACRLRWQGTGAGHPPHR
ncbi:MAG: beta-ketoacyl-ACP synthase 3 [Nitrospirota bacterium]|nr:beta-ketoacyl-ACP synthase 3 [Nitrospirota bacterium]